MHVIAALDVVFRGPSVTVPRLFRALAAAGAISRALLPTAIVAAGCFLHGTSNANRVEVIRGSLEQTDIVPTTARGPIDIPVALTASELAVKEPLGIFHPDQVIDFDRRIDAAHFHLVAVDGAVVHHQRLSGNRLAVRIRGGLHPNETRRFWIVPGAASSTPADDIDALRVMEATNYYEIANPLVAVRVPKAISPGHALAPIQAVRLRNDSWLGSELGRSVIVDLQGWPIQIKDAQLTFIERGPLVVTVEITYKVARPALVYGGTVLVPAGEGFYRATITLQAGQPSVLIEEDTDMDVRWALDLDALKPDQARYQGHHATSVENGFEFDGRQYRPTHERPNMDAFVNLPLQRHRRHTDAFSPGGIPGPSTPVGIGNSMTRTRPRRANLARHLSGACVADSGRTLFGRDRAIERARRAASGFAILPSRTGCEGVFT